MLLPAVLAIIACAGPSLAADWSLRGGSTDEPPVLAAQLEPADRIDREWVSRSIASTVAEDETRTARAATPAPTPRAPRPLVRYHVYDQPVEGALRALSQITGTPIVIESAIEGRIRSETLAGSLGSIVAQLSGRYGFFYAFDGTRFIVSSRHDTVTDVTEVPGDSFDEAVSLMGRVFPAVAPGSVRVSRDLGVVMLRGPKSFVDAERTALSYNKVERVKIIRGGQSSIIKLGEDDPALPPSR